MILYLAAFLLFSSVPQIEGHKPIQSDGKNLTYENALLIPDHQISWAVYEELKPFQTKFYSFEAKKGELFYTSIVIPKLERLEGYSPSLAIAGEQISIEDFHKIAAELPPGGIVVYDFDGSIPSKEFYEPFTQTTYWERQEVQITIPATGKYYILVSDLQGISGKYSLAVGTIEDFSFLDFFTILPAAWFSTKLFFEDYVSVSIFIIISLALLSVIIIRILKNSKSTMYTKRKPSY